MTTDLKSMSVDELLSAIHHAVTHSDSSLAAAELARRLQEAEQKIAGDALAVDLLKRLMKRIFENADMSLPDATDVELQLIRQLSSIDRDNDIKAQGLEEADR